MRKGTDICKCLLWHSKMPCAPQIHFVFYLWNISQTSYNSIPTVEFMWLIKYGWKWRVPLPSMANTCLLHMDLHSPLQWPWRPRIRIRVSKDGRRLGSRMTAWSSLDSPHHLRCQLHWTLIWGLFVTAVRAPRQVLLPYAECSFTHVHSRQIKKNSLKIQ